MRQRNNYTVEDALGRIANGLENLCMYKEASDVDNAIGLVKQADSKITPDELFKQISIYSKMGEGYSRKHELGDAIDEFVRHGDIEKRLLEIMPELENIFFENGKPVEHDSPYHSEDIWTHIVGVVRSSGTHRLKTLREKVIVFLAALFHDIGKPSVKKFVDREGTGISYEGRSGLYQYINHAEVGSKMLDGIFQKFGIGGEIASTVKGMVAVHNNFHEQITNYKRTDKLSKGYGKILDRFGNKEEAARLLGVLCKADNTGATPNHEAISNMAKGMRLNLKDTDYDYDIGDRMHEAHNKMRELAKQPGNKPVHSRAIDDIKKDSLRRYLHDDAGMDFEAIAQIVTPDVITLKDLVERLRQVGRADLMERIVKSGIV